MKLAMMLPNPNDATSMARGAMPLAMLARTMGRDALAPSSGLRPPSPAPAGEGLELVTREAWSWSDVCVCDAVFIQRPYSADHYQLAVMAKQLDLPLWVDYDDALDALPVSNPLWSVRRAREMAGHLSACCQLANVVTVTTAALAARVTKLLSDAGKLTAGKVRVIPNAHNDYLLPFVDAPRLKFVTWRGSATHDEDLLPVLPQLAAVANDPEFADWKFAFLGDPPWAVRQQMPCARTCYSAEGWQNYFLFMNEWAGCCPAIHIVPLADSEFNHCKSNLAWLEASAVGAVTLADERFTEFQQLGVTHYGQGLFGASLKYLMRKFNAPASDLGLADLLGMSRRHIRENLLLSRVNELRRQVLHELLQAPASKIAK